MEKTVLCKVNYVQYGLIHRVYINFRPTFAEGISREQGVMKEFQQNDQKQNALWLYYMTVILVL